MNKDEEIKHLTALNERNHSQIIALKESCRLLDAKVSEEKATNLAKTQELKVMRLKWLEAKDELGPLGRRFERLMLERDNLVDQNMQLQNMLYGVIGMLSEQNAETVLSQLDKLQRATMGW